MVELNTLIDKANSNVYFAGLMMILLNIGSKYVVMEISDTQEQFLSNIIVRRLLVFTIFFIGTRDVYVSFILTAIFIIFVTGLFNEKSKYCILPKKMKYIPKEGRTISEEELKYAEKIIQLSNEQQIEKQNYLKKINNKNKKDKMIYKNNLETLQLFKD